MRKFLLLIIFFTVLGLFNYVKADDWSEFSNADNMWDGQKSITNKEFEQVIDALEEKKVKKEKKQFNKKVKKVSGGGTSLHNNIQPTDDFTKITPLTKNKDGLLLNIPVNLIIDEILLEKGYYKILAEIDKNNDIYFLFYQSQFFKGKVKANETTNDYNQEDVNFVKLLPYNDNFVKIIYGSIDFNAYAYIRYKE